MSGRGQGLHSVSGGAWGSHNSGGSGRGENPQRGKKRGGPGRGKNSSKRGDTGDGFWTTAADDSKATAAAQPIKGADGSQAAGSNSRFESACQQIQASLNKYLEEHPITELSDEEEEELQEGVLDRVVSSAAAEGSEEALQQLKDALSTGGLTCLICIHAVKRVDQTWSCQLCYSVLHLQCVQKWAQDSIYQRAEQQRQMHDHDIRVDLTKLQWSCPKCRHQYPQTSIPRQYMCYCGKTEDPEFDPWLLPHSCGEKCGRPLQPECGHTCLMLCHPGPCAPCPVTVSVLCECGQSGPSPHRCSRKHWTCSRPCNKLLSCQQHRCTAPCHSGPCNACPRTSSQQCHCGAVTQLRPCNDPRWSCEEVCNRPFPCGHHHCELPCHPPGGCGDQCPSSSSTRHCPCGKTPQSADLPCHAAVPVCGDTCERLLTCGQHYCADRCHYGPCSTCLEYCEKRCRCGARSRKLPCSKELTCDTKCKRFRDCRKHPCNRKCCVGDCPPCEQPCGKTLQCGNHKCTSRCHTGPCFPCNITVKLSCPCGGTSLTVPCGRERVSKGPRCSKPCTLRSRCHHTKQPRHLCHDGPCPPCVQVCQVRHSTCQHTCPASCHDNVPVRVVDDRQRAGPWEPVMAPRTELRKMPCPPCKMPVSVLCRGSHEVGQFPCSSARHYSCGRPCGRGLACTNHLCRLDCHYLQGDADNGDLLDKHEKKMIAEELVKRVTKAPVLAGENCYPCSRGCEKVPVAGCSHLCQLPCHPGQCPPCEAKMKYKCHCGLVMVFKRCREWTAIKGNHKQEEEAKSCGNQCYKLMSCGHGCRLICHSGRCSDPGQCKERVPVRCPCGRQRREMICSEVTAASGGKQPANSPLACDAACLAKKREAGESKAAERLRQQEAEEAERRRELEEFERRMAGGRRGGRGRRKEGAEQGEERQTLWQQYRMFIAVGAGILAALAGVVYAAG